MAQTIVAKLHEKQGGLQILSLSSCTQPSHIMSNWKGKGANSWKGQGDWGKSGGGKGNWSYGGGKAYGGYGGGKPYHGKSSAPAGACAGFSNTGQGIKDTFAELSSLGELMALGSQVSSLPAFGGAAPSSSGVSCPLSPAMRRR